MYIAEVNTSLQISVTFDNAYFSIGNKVGA